MMRAMAIEFPGDRQAQAIDDQFMLGLRRAGRADRGAGCRGAAGVSARGRVGRPLDRCVDAGGWITARAPVDVIPVYLRGGSCIPLWMPDAVDLGAAVGLPGEGRGRLVLMVTPGQGETELVDPVSSRPWPSCRTGRRCPDRPCQRRTRGGHAVAARRGGAPRLVPLAERGFECAHRAGRAMSTDPRTRPLVARQHRADRSRTRRVRGVHRRARLPHLLVQLASRRELHRRLDGCSWAQRQRQRIPPLGRAHRGAICPQGGASGGRGGAGDRRDRRPAASAGLTATRCTPASPSTAMRPASTGATSSSMATGSGSPAWPGTST